MTLREHKKQLARELYHYCAAIWEKDGRNPYHDPSRRAEAARQYANELARRHNLDLPELKP